jgi:hypothetical protein
MVGLGGERHVQRPHVAAVEQFAEGQELHAELSRPGVALSLSGSAPGLLSGARSIGTTGPGATLKRFLQSPNHAIKERVLCYSVG